jgi:hypothetical protein
MIGSPSSELLTLIACHLVKLRSAWRGNLLTIQSSRKFDIAKLLMVTRGIFLSRVRLELFVDSQDMYCFSGLIIGQPGKRAEKQNLPQRRSEDWVYSNDQISQPVVDRDC